jgi:hypothetical protein
MEGFTMAEESRCWRIGDVIYDTVSFRLWKPHKREPSRPLGPREAELLYFFIRNYPKRLTFKTPAQVMKAAWGQELSDDSLYKSTQALRDELGDFKKEIIVAPQHRLEVEPIAVPCPSVETLKSKHLPSRVQDLRPTENEIRLSVNDSNSNAPSPTKSDWVRTTAGMFDRNALFSYPGGYADAIRLFGSGSQYVPPERFFVDYTHSLYTRPRELRNSAMKRIVRLEDEARRSNKVFFNGPVVRLVRWHHNQKSPTEIDTLRLELAAAGWYDLEGINGLIREEASQRDAYTSYVDIGKIESGDFENGCHLSNVVGNAVTVFTADGKVGFQRRGFHQSAVPGHLTSAIAENVNRYKDDTDRDRPTLLLNIPFQSSPLAKDPAYAPQGKPHPLAAVLRGLSHEVSSRILRSVGSHAIKVTGLAFGLDCLAPDLLWIVLVNVTEEEFLVIRRDRPGIEVDEGVIEFVPPSFDSTPTQELLMRSDWVPAGKASLVRAIHLIEEFSPSGDPLEAFRALANAA